MEIQLLFGQAGIRLREQVFAWALLPAVMALVVGLLYKFGLLMPTVWAGVYGIAVLWFALTWQRTIEAVVTGWFLFLLPALALFSALWSADPGKTLTAGIQFAFSTLVALRIAQTLPARSCLIALFAVVALGVILSLLAFVLPPLQPAFERNGAYIGIYVQKTVAGVGFALFVLTALAVGGIHRWPLLALLLSAATLPLIAITDSISAFLLLAFAIVPLAQPLLARGNGTLRFGLFLLLFVTAAALVGVLWLDEFDLSEAFLGGVGKSSTLTGRTEIWSVGLELWERAPLLGTGFRAFWYNPVYGEYWGALHATIDPRLNGFHNFYVEAMVTTGIFGLLTVLAVYGAILARVCMWYIRTGTMISAAWMTLLLSGLALSLFDNVFFAEHEKYHIFAVMSYVFATRALRPGHTGT